MTINDCNEFILAQYKNVSNSQEHFSKMFKDKEEIEDEFDWFLCVESYKKSRCKWLTFNGLKMSKSEKKLWNSILDSIGKES
jgi:hypothetical protein